jgi:hypothetical protein
MIFQIAINYTNWLQIMPNFSMSRSSKNIPKFVF